MPLNLRHAEHLLPPNAPLTGQWTCHRCMRCAHAFRLDVRVTTLPAMRHLRRAGLVQLRCTRCGSAELESTGLCIS